MPDKLTERKFTQPSTAALRFLLSVRYSTASLFFVLFIGNIVLSSLPNACALHSASKLYAANADGNADDYDSSTEIVQLPHAFRHQGHYSQRVEQAVQSFRTAAQQQQQNAFKTNVKTTASPFNERPTAAGLDAAQNIHDATKRRPQSTHQEPLFNQKQHQKQQENHHHHQHHLRHHHEHHHPNHHPHHQAASQHHSHNKLINLKRDRYQQPLSITATTEASFNPFIDELMAFTTKQNKSHRYFDRHNIYQNPLASIYTTRGPNVDKAMKPSYMPLDGDDKQWKEEENYYATIGKENRITIPLTMKSEAKGRDREIKPSQSKALAMNKDDENDDDDHNDDEDYNYDDNDELDNADENENVFELSKHHTHRGDYEIQNQQKTAVKRFTNPFKSFFYPKSKAETKQRTNLKLLTYSDTKKQQKTNEESNENEKSQNDNENNDDDDDDSEESNSYSAAKWSKIEYDHHLKQLQHQQEMQKLRKIGLQHSGKKYSESDNELEYQHVQSYVPGTLSQRKQLELGTIDAVHESRLSHLSSDSANRALAKAHVSKIQREASCRIPQKRVQRIQQDPSKVYLPHCTVLHRCGDDTGCCRAPHLTCVAKNTNKVDLYFFVKGIHDKKGTIERFTFVNHTECHCVERQKHHPNHEEFNGTQLRAEDSPQRALEHASIINCNCPKLYEKILQDDGYCRCDCSSGNIGCDRLKRGMEHFAMDARKCIVEGRCKLPTCEYGNYNRKHGRCPRREEQLLAALGSTTNNDLNSYKQQQI